jgi:AraC family transcriptional regulator
MTTLATPPDPLTLATLLEEARELLHADPLQAGRRLADAIALVAPEPEVYRGLAPWQVSRVRLRISADPVHGVACEDLAALTRLSVRQFSRAFKASFGLTPHAYVVHARIAMAQQRLLQGQRLSEISQSCGFASQAHFCRAFRTATGYTPTTWLNHAALAASSCGQRTVVC